MKHLGIVVGTSICLLLFIGQISLFTPVVNAATAPSFSPSFNLSHDTARAKQPAVSNNGQNVYVAWTEGSGGIRFRHSTDGGTTWAPPLTQRAMRLGPSTGTAQFPVMFTEYQQVNSGDVYVAWTQSVSGVLQIFVAASTNNGASFTTTQLSTAGGITPTVGAWGSDVYVAWYQTRNCYGPNTGGCIDVAASSNNGAANSWTTYTLNPSTNGEPQLVAYGSNAYIIADGVYYSELTNNGATLAINSVLLYGFGTNTVNGNTVVTFGREPWIAGSGSDVHVTFNAIDLTSSSVLYRIYGLTSHDGGSTWTPSPAPFVTPSAQQSMLLSGTIRNDWEPENAAFGSDMFLTFHALSNQGIYMISSTNAGTSWSAPVLVSATGRQSAYAHVFTSDGTNVFVMWGQAVSRGSSTWNAYVSYSGNGGTTWSPTQINISNNPTGVAAGNLDVTLFALSSNGIHCFAAWTYTSGTTSQIYFASS